MNTSMRGRTVLITGSTGGIGRETARGLAGLGARVILVGRDAGRAEAAARELRRDTGNDAVAALTADLTRLRDVRRLAEEVAGRCDALHVLVNNAGANTARRQLTEDGVETAFAVNVLVPFTLTHLLLPLLRRGARRGDEGGRGGGAEGGRGGGGAEGGAGGGEGSGGAASRVVNITGGIPRGPIDPSNLQGERRYLGWTFSQYNHSKVALMAMSRRLAERLAGSGVTVNVAYPGHGHTPGNRAIPTAAFPFVYRPLAPLVRLLAPVLLADLSRPARSSVYLASSPEVEGVTGTYVDTNCRRAAWPAGALRPGDQEAVWELCARLSGLPAA
ncbi:SDR family NAD(P)-dependent oxidoreductase [Allostreptomyces psammosilenae]|uniref:NAD(P)-dependent dehydrogenase (Short-subunit alcohol dehydrogenase family) n=1 Tax=Allostreptomyces psammosilenae TaxID=1892865 RepID=A0A852ZX86_9ACTN|nr:SDR family NAD(P)-dependent oxidoreductase [Allostreptomyces psammosilenae]NYI05334.1 NAD(P)-dependent dehydrogenase (short-subunit alcohol dehydrogenase family) [Allostreptomyces psammosilenae]